MGIQDLGAIGEFISSIVITITLVFLVFETRNAKEASLQGNRQLRQQIQNSILMGHCQNKELAGAMVKADAQLSPEFGERYEARAKQWGLSSAEYLMVINLKRAEFSFYEDQYFTELPNADRNAVDSKFVGIMRGPVANEFWQAQKHFYDDDFKKYVDHLVAKSGVSTGKLPGDFRSKIR